MNNDRFKFRVWDKKNNEYIYFSFFSIKSELTYQKIEIITKNKIEQSTGLKDKNGRLIYEGDIILIDKYDKDYDYSGEKVRTLVGERGYISTTGNKLLNRNISKFPCLEKEIIGTIHDNPEMIKE